MFYNNKVINYIAITLLTGSVYHTLLHKITKLKLLKKQSG